MIELKVIIQSSDKGAEITLSKPGGDLPDSAKELMELLIAQELFPHLQKAVTDSCRMAVTEAEHRRKEILGFAKKLHEKGACHATRH